MISDERKQQFDGLVARYPEKRSALIPILHEVQARDGYLSQEALVEVAQYLGLHPVEVAETASFYDLLRLRPAGAQLRESARKARTNPAAQQRVGYETTLRQPLGEAHDASRLGRQGMKGLVVRW